MSTSLVIVAIPEETDRVQKISSEKTPHMTLLYLGDITPETPAAQIVQFVEHAVQLSEHGPFYLDVKRRGELGEDNADVLFFNERSWNLKWIKQFRGQLLQNEQIRSAYDSAEQFGAPQEWVPHLTLGYPTAPAKPLGKEGFDDYPIYSVCFDRISVWLEDSDGPEFFLEWPDREFAGDQAIAYSDMQKAALTHAIANGLDLEHHGVKGMKWGVTRRNAHGAKAVRLNKKADSLERAASATKNDTLRRRSLKANAAKTRKKADFAQRIADGKGRKTEKVTVAGKDKMVSPRKAAKLEKKWEKSVYTADSTVKVHNAMADHFNSRIGAINDKYKDNDFSGTKWENPDSWTPREKQYMGEVNKLTNEGYSSAVKSVHGSSPSGTKEAVYEPNGNGTPEEGGRIVIRDKAAQHAATDSADQADVIIQVKLDSTGHFIEANKAEQTSTAEHGEVFVDGLMHGSAERGEAFILEHYGIKGMHWGQRKGPPEAVSPSATSKVPHGNRRKTKIETEGGQNHPAHNDAIKVAQAKAKLKKSGPAALSNQELRDVANRVQLENQVSILTGSKGKQFTQRHLETAGNQTVQRGIAKGIAKGAAKKGGKAALLFA